MWGGGLTERIAQPVGTNAKMQANMSPTVKDVNRKATATPAKAIKKASPWKNRSIS